MCIRDRVILDLRTGVQTAIVGARGPRLARESSNWMIYTPDSVRVAGDSTAANGRGAAGAAGGRGAGGRGAAGGAGAAASTGPRRAYGSTPGSYTHLRAHATALDLVCRLLLEKKKAGAD